MLTAIILLFLLCCVSSYYAIKFALLLIKLEDVIETSLDEIDQSYKDISKILKKPIFFDSVEVRACITEIRKLRNIMLKIADSLTSISSQKLNNSGEDIEQIKREEKNA